MAEGLSQFGKSVPSIQQLQHKLNGLDVNTAAWLSADCCGVPKLELCVATAHYAVTTAATTPAGQQQLQQQQLQRSWPRACCANQLHCALPAATAPPDSAAQQLQPWLRPHLPCTISQVSLVPCFVCDPLLLQPCAERQWRHHHHLRSKF